MQIRFYVLFFLLITLSACRGGKPIISNRKNAMLVLNEYEKKQITWKSFMYFHDSIHQNKRTEVKVPSLKQDSVLSIVKYVLLNNQHLSINIPNSLENKISPEIYNLDVFSLNARKITTNMILKHIPDSGFYIFPVFCTVFDHGHTMSSGYSGGWVYSASDKIEIVIYIIDKKQVIYKRFARLYSSHVQDPNNPNQNLRTIKQEHWQLIIDKALEDYIKRLKVPAHKLEQNN